MDAQNTYEQLITIGMAVLGTQITRWLVWWLIPSGKTSSYVRYIGDTLPAAIFGVLVIYCYKDVHPLENIDGVLQIVAGALVVALQFWKKNMFISIIGGTAFYILLRYFFI